MELKNFGTNNITSADIEWEINGTPQTTVAYSGTLAPNATTTVLLASNFNFTNGTYAITVRTNNPNNTTDGNTSNDELQRTINVGAFPPTNITHTEVTPNDVYAISWTGDNTQTYELEYGSFGFSQGTGTTISNISGTSQNISGIDPAMNGYDVYVRSFCGSTPSAWSAPYSFGTVPFFVSNETELDAALAAAANDDVIFFLNNIVITSQKTISGKTITINGQGFELSVPRPGLDDMGRFNSNPSGFRVLQLSSSANVTINDLTIKGGVANSNGGAILVNSGTILNINNSVVSNTNAGASNGGGGIAISGTMFMKNSFVRRNAARFGGGILVTGTGRAYVEESTMVENRSTATNGGGGAAECQSGSILYFNNSTLSNNQSTEIGGAINNFNGKIYFINSSATGNVAFGNFSGGAIGNNGGNVYILNSLFAHNYRRTSGSVTDPTGYVLDDFQPHSNPGGIRVYHSIFHATLPTGLAIITGNVQYTGAADGSNNSIFSGGLLSKITDNDGNEIGDQIFRPFLFNNQGSVAPTLQVGSFVSQSANLGVPTRFANNNNSNPAVAYFDGSTWIDILGTSATGQEVTTDQVGDARSSTEPARGAIEAELNATLFIVKVNGASGGTVNGGTIYGDVYPEGTSVTLTAIPNSGQQFVSWDYVAGATGTASTSNPYTFTVTQDVTLVPVFGSSGGNFSITYIGNGNTRGSVPAGGSFSTSQTIAGPGSLGRRGFEFTGWNTNSNGSGTSFAEAASSGTDNLTLYAQWSQISDLQDLIISGSGATPTITGNKFVSQGGSTNTVNVSSISTALSNGDLVLQAKNITISSDIAANTRGLILEADKVIIDANVSVDELVSDATEIEVEPGISLNVVGTFNNRMTSGALLLKADANGYSQIKFGSIEGRTNITQQKNLHAGWNMLGAPMNATTADFFGAVGTSTGFSTIQNLFSWNGENYDNLADNSATITPGMGYFGFVGNYGVRPVGVESFTGTPNTSVSVPTLYDNTKIADGSVTMSTNVTDREGWNLLANPFTCNLDVAGISSTGLAEAFYLFDGTNYQTYAKAGINNGVVPPLSAFWMQADGVSPTLGSGN